MKLTADVTEQSFTLSGYEDSAKILYFGFTDSDGLPVIFDDLSFGFQLKNENEILSEDSFPKEGMSYKSTDQEFLISAHLTDMKLGEPYKLFVWVVNAGVRWDQSFDVMLPRWKQPYPSWTWNESNDCWIAPIPYPTDGGIYVWDEDQMAWIMEG